METTAKTTKRRIEYYAIPTTTTKRRVEHYTIPTTTTTTTKILSLPTLARRWSLQEEIQPRGKEQPCGEQTAASKLIFCYFDKYLNICMCPSQAYHPTQHQGGINCGAIDEPRKSSKAIDERVIINFRDKNVLIARFRDKNVVIARFRDKNVVFAHFLIYR